MSTLVVLRPEDAPRLAELLTPALGASWTERAIHEELTRRGVLALGIERDGGLEGALLGWVIAGELEIHAVVVQPEARRGGLGRRLLEEAIARATAEGACAAFLELRADNEPAKQLYLRCGFALLDVRRGYYGDGTDALVLRGALGGP